LESVHTRATESQHAETRRKTTEEKARRILKEELDKLGWTGAELAKRAKGQVRKIQIAGRLRAETAVTLKWIAKELHMSTWTHVANRLQKTKAKDDVGHQDQINLVQKLRTGPL
jgi:transcriptional regulator with XRE-family HTH domain